MPTLGQKRAGRGNAITNTGKAKTGNNADPSAAEAYLRARQEAKKAQGRGGNGWC
jgi:hypothetical protein